MPSRYLLAIFLALTAVGARLPFLVTGKIPFDSDEAVEALMARHVLEGELPVFFWGQAFKGVPEVYLSAGAFALFGSSVTVLKSVTLVLFATYVALNFVLLDKLISRWVASAASVLLIAAPPAFVFWTLDASAEYVVIMLLGTILLLLCLRRHATHATVATHATFPIGLAIGAGFWVHQLFVVYLIPLAIMLAVRSEPWKGFDRRRANKLAFVLGAIAGVYFVLAVTAFLFGGFSLQLGSLAISATAPQKMARIAVAVGALAILVQIASTSTAAQTRDMFQRYWRVAAGFLIGYSPVILYSLFVEPARSPARVANLQQLVAASPDIVGNIVPILAGFKVPPTADRLAIAAVAGIPAIAALVAFFWSSRRRLTTDFFALFVIMYPVLFLSSGAYLDTQSYRYFIPWYAGLVLAWAVGSVALVRIVRLSAAARWIHTASYFASIVVALIVAVHAWQQVLWYQKLQPDTQSLATIECLKRNGIKGGYAEYWTAYKLTFLAREEIIIAPTDGIDRYPRYTEYVRSLPERARIDDAARCN